MGENGVKGLYVRIPAEEFAVLAAAEPQYSTLLDAQAGKKLPILCMRLGIAKNLMFCLQSLEAQQHSRAQDVVLASMHGPRCFQMHAPLPLIRDEGQYRSSLKVTQDKMPFRIFRQPCLPV